MTQYFVKIFDTAVAASVKSAFGKGGNPLDGATINTTPFNSPKAIVVDSSWAKAEN